MDNIYESPAKYRHLTIFDLMELEAYASEQNNEETKDITAPEPEYFESEDEEHARKKHKTDHEQYTASSSAEESDSYESEPFADTGHESTGQDIISRICQQAELAVELGKHLEPSDIVTLYSINRSFHETVSKYMLSSVRNWIKHKAAEAGRILPFTIYRRYLISDPTGRTWSNQANETDVKSSPREIPGLQYLQFIISRDRECREIKAILARNGHRTPYTMHSTLLKLWMLMDIVTTGQRAAVLRNTNIWSEVDLYNAQLFFVKLGMHFNDPVYGPNSYELVHLMLGQKGLHKLWQLLMGKKYTRLSELLELKMRYNTIATLENWTSDYMGEVIHGVHYDDLGTGHLEGWGQGQLHLSRPDELVPIEAVARGLELDAHITNMMLWGHIDWTTGENLVPTVEEMYISDSDEALKNVDTTHHWKRKHARKKMFDSLSSDEQQAIICQDEDDRLRAMAWCGSDIDDYSSIEDEEEHEDIYTLDDEIERGFIVGPQREGVVPSATDTDGWVDFVNSALQSLTVNVDEEEALRAQAWQSYQTVEFDNSWDWGVWLRQQQQQRRQRLDEFDYDSDDDGDDEDSNMDVSDDEPDTVVDQVLSWT